MKAAFVFLLISAVVLKNGIAQSSKIAILQKRGIEAMQSGNYRGADSLFSLSLDLFKDPDTYFNRALSRLKLRDSLGFCTDMNEARLLGDTEAEKLYARKCIYTDTVYYDSTYSVTNDLRKCFYYEIIETSRFEQKVNKIKVDRDKEGCFYKTLYDGLVTIFIKDLQAEVPVFEKGGSELDRIMKNTMKYPFEAREKSIEGTVYIAFTINEDGTLTNFILRKGHR